MAALLINIATDMNGRMAFRDHLLDACTCGQISLILVQEGSYQEEHSQSVLSPKTAFFM
jgi:hypothetical protein